VISPLLWVTSEAANQAASQPVCTEKKTRQLFFFFSVAAADVVVLSSQHCFWNLLDCKTVTNAKTLLLVVGRPQKLNCCCCNSCRVRRCDKGLSKGWGMVDGRGQAGVNRTSAMPFADGIHFIWFLLILLQLCANLLQFDFLLQNNLHKYLVCQQ